MKENEFENQLYNNPNCGFEENKPEIKEVDKGKNVEVSIRLTRHGEKDEKGNLSEEGKVKAEDYGKQYLDPDKIRVTRVSRKKRVIETAETALKQLGKKIRMREKFELSSESVVLDSEKSDFFRRADERLAEANNMTDEKERNQKIEKAEEKNVLEWLSYNDQRPDKGTASPKEVVRNLAPLIKRNLDFVSRLKSGTKVEFFNVTHEFMLAALIKYLIKKRTESRGLENGEEIMRNTGRIKPLEDIVIKAQTDENGAEEQIEVLFRGEKYELDLDKLNELCEQHKTSKENLKLEKNEK